MNDLNPRAKASQIFLLMASFVIVVAGMRAAEPILVPFLMAAFISFLCSPIMFWLQRVGFPKWLAILVTIIVILAVGLLIGTLIGSSIKNFIGDIPTYEVKLRQQTSLFINWLNKLGIEISNRQIADIFNPGAVMGLVGMFLNNLSGVLTNGFLILMTVVFILLEASSFPSKLHSISGNPDSSMSRLDQFLNDINRYLAIKTMISLVTGILVTVFLLIIDLDYPFVWGLIAFILNYIPNIGSIIASIPAILLALVQFGYIWAGIVAIGYFAINIILGGFIEPRLMGRGLGLSPLVVFLSLIFWGWILGPVGMLLSVLLTVTAKIALESREDTQWLAVILGPDISPKHKN